MKDRTLTGKDLVLGKMVLLYVDEKIGWWPSTLRRIGETHHYYEVMGRDMVAKKSAPSDMTAPIGYARMCRREDLDELVQKEVRNLVSEIFERLSPAIKRT
jgi:hypothetical protein